MKNMLSKENTSSVKADAEIGIIWAVKFLRLENHS